MNGVVSLNWFLFILYMLIFLILVYFTFLPNKIKIISRMWYYVYTPTIWMVEIAVYTSALLKQQKIIENDELIFEMVFFILLLILTIQISAFFIFLLKDTYKVIRSDFPPILNEKKYMLLLILGLVMIMIIPNVIFQLFYDLWYKYSILLTNKNSELSLFDMFYFSFGINYSLPLTGKFNDLKDIVSNKLVLEILQIIHVVIIKLLDWIVIGYIISIFLSLLHKKNMRTNSISVADEILKLTKLRNQKKISKDQFEKIVDKLINNN